MTKKRNQHMVEVSAETLTQLKIYQQYIAAGGKKPSLKEIIAMAVENL